MLEVGECTFGGQMLFYLSWHIRVFLPFMGFILPIFMFLAFDFDIEGRLVFVLMGVMVIGVLGFLVHRVITSSNITLTVFKLLKPKYTFNIFTVFILLVVDGCSGSVG